MMKKRLYYQQTTILYFIFYVFYGCDEKNIQFKRYWKTISNNNIFHIGLG